MGKGGGGSPAPAPSSQTVTQTNLPEYARPYYEDIMNRAQVASQVQYQPYMGERVAGFNPMQEQAFVGTANMGPSPLLGTAAGMTGISGLGGLGAGAQYAQQATSPGAMAAYMSPYMQNVVDMQKESAVRDYGRTLPGQQAAATRAGAFGGSRHAIIEAEGIRNLQNQLAGIQATGSQQAFDQARQAQQFGADLGLRGYGLAGQAGQQLGQLGQAAFGQQAAALQAQQQAGAVMQAQEQQRKDVAYEEFMRQQTYPQTQLQLYSSLLRGVPVTPQQTMFTYQQAPSTLSQLGTLGMGAYGLSKAFSSKAGGEIRGYAEGGITSGMGGGAEPGTAEFTLLVTKIASEIIKGKDPDAIPPSKALDVAKGLPHVLQAMQQRAGAERQMALEQGRGIEQQPSVLAQAWRDAQERERDIQEPQALAGISALDTGRLEGDDVYSGASGGIVAFQSAGEVRGRTEYTGPREDYSTQMLNAPSNMDWRADFRQDELPEDERRAVQRRIGAMRNVVTPGGIASAVITEPAVGVTRAMLQGLGLKNLAGRSELQPQLKPAQSPEVPYGLGLGTEETRPGTTPAAVPRPTAPAATPRPTAQAAPAPAAPVASSVKPVDESLFTFKPAERTDPDKAASDYLTEMAKHPSDAKEAIADLKRRSELALKERNSDMWLSLAAGAFKAVGSGNPRFLGMLGEALGYTASEALKIRRQAVQAQDARDAAMRAEQRAERQENLGNVKEATRLRAQARRDNLNADRFDQQMQAHMVQSKVFSKHYDEQADIARERIKSEERTRQEIAAGRAQSAADAKDRLEYQKTQDRELRREAAHIAARQKVSSSPEMQGYNEDLKNEYRKLRSPDISGANRKRAEATIKALEAERQQFFTRRLQEEIGVPTAGGRGDGLTQDQRALSDKYK